MRQVFNKDDPAAAPFEKIRLDNLKKPKKLADFLAEQDAKLKVAAKADLEEKTNADLGT